MSKYLGDYTEDYAALNFKFTTRAATGVPTSLAEGAVKVYKANATDSETSTGVTLTADFDTVTGLNNVLVDLSADAFYATGQDYAVVITAGTVGGVSVVGEVLCTFSIENRTQKADLRQIIGHTLTQAGTQVADAFQSFFNVATPTGTVNSLPAAAPGAANGLFIAGTNAATTITTALTTTFTGNLTGSVASVTAKTGYSLAATGLDAITATAPAGVADTFPKMLVQLWWRFFKKATKTDTLIKTYAADGATVVTTQTVGDDGATETQGAAT
jgi:hypothetical protein